ncbi:hypothetical protein Drorol1_Dr00022269 [Drosera rotundifolia]
MVVIGLDFGNQRAVVAIKTEWGIGLVLDDISNVFSIHSVVFFSDKGRYFGREAFSRSLIDPSYVVFAIKGLIGVLFPESREDIERLPFVVKEGPDGFPLIHINYKGGDSTFTPTQVFTYLKGIAQKKGELDSLSLKHRREEFLARKYQKMDVLPLKMSAEYYVPSKITRKDPVDYFCIGIPAYFTDLQRRAILNAAKIAGLNQVEAPETTSENTAVPVKEFVIGALSSSDLQAAMKQEEEMHNENLKIVKEEDEIYAMQSYLYVMGLMGLCILSICEFTSTDLVVLFFR